MKARVRNARAPGNPGRAGPAVWHGKPGAGAARRHDSSPAAAIASAGRGCGRRACAIPAHSRPSACATASRGTRARIGIRDPPPRRSPVRAGPVLPDRARWNGKLNASLAPAVR